MTAPHVQIAATASNLTTMPRLIPSPLYHPDFEHDACGVGFVARIDGERNHDVILRALAALRGLAHRGAIDADAITGDGAGIMTQIPVAFLRPFLAHEGQALAREEDLGVGMFFLPKNNPEHQVAGQRIVEQAAAEQGLTWLCWRHVPVNGLCLGRKALETQPLILQALVSRTEGTSADDFERKMFFLQKIAERRAAEQQLDGFYVCSSSSRTIVYKGLFNAPQLRRFYSDLMAPDFTSAFAIFHQRYLTNTFPNWQLAHPFRMLAHNGEINTIRANRNVMRARERYDLRAAWEGDNGLPAGALDLTFTGSAGQSFGAFLVEGVRLTLSGEANDCVGKGMSGGEIIVRPKAEETFEWHTNCLVGNACLYGATGGTLFLAGLAGERFAVRNSGATAVVDGVGDHGCEYMTGGVVVVLHRIGMNFAAGMSGGLVFVHDAEGVLPERHNAQMSSAERLQNAEEIGSLRRLLERHAELTDSPHAQSLLNHWETTVGNFWKIIPHPPHAAVAEPFLQIANLKVLAA